jgi:hypothetical protein
LALQNGSESYALLGGHDIIWPLMLVHDDTTYPYVERVLNSSTFRNAEVLRRLLKFLAETSIAGETNQLKEYTEAVDGLGKPDSYDPRQDSLVRIQIGRLRHKLADYYRTEGQNDSVILEIPKGHFKLTWADRQVEAAVPSPLRPSTSTAPVFVPSARWSRTHIIVVAILAFWALGATILLQREHSASAPLRAAWTRELQELWQLFLQSSRPLVVAVSSPLFVGLQGNGFFRDQTLNQWDEVLISAKVQAIRKALNNPAIVQRYYYTGLGEMGAAFRLGTLLDYSGLKISTTRSSLVSWQQIVDDNLLLVGPPRVFGDALHKLPVDLDFVMREDGIHDQKVKTSQQPLFADNYPSINADQTSIPDNGEVYALVSRMPGPLGTGKIQSFNSNHSPGVQGAVEYFTAPAFARELITKLRKSNGQLPPFFQVVLRVRYRDLVPTEISYVTHRELRPETSAGSTK